MKKKTFIVQLLDSKKPSRTSFTQVEDALFYSNDTDAYLVFLPHEQEGFEFNEATVALYNTNDESLVERPAVIETFEGRKSVVLKMTEDLLAHWGRWQAQVVFKQGDKINTSVVVKFDTLRYMLDQRPPTLRDVIKVDELYSQLVTVMDEIAGKDVISAPEIILARGGENTLGERLDKEYNEISDELTHTVKKTNDIAVNPRDFGAKFNGVDDDTDALKQSLLRASTNGSEVLLSGTVVVSEKIEIPEGVTITSYNAVLKPAVNSDVIELNRNTTIKGHLVIDVRHLGAGFTSDVIKLDGKKRLSYRDISLDNIFIYGSTTYGKGTAIHFECVTPISDISFVKFNNVIIRGFEKGIFMDAPLDPLATQYNYINGNLFNNLIISDCDYYIYGTGSGSSTAQVGGNVFSNVQLQYNTRAKEMIHLEGNGNVINGYLWDVSSKDCLAVNLTKTSINNVINTEGSLTATYVDEGSYNEINALDQYYDVVPVRASRTSKARFRYEGDYQNVLHKADSLHSVSVSEGAETRLGGNLGGVFDSMKVGDLRLDLSGEKLYSFEILFDASKYVGYSVSYLQGGLNTLGFTFSFERVPKKIHVEVTSPNGVTRISEIDMQYQKNRPYVRLTRNSVNGLASDIQKIKITLVGQFSEDVRLASVYANSPNISGNKYISNAGGRVVGDLIFENQSQGVVLSSPNGSKYRLKIDDAGAITTDKL